MATDSQNKTEETTESADASSLQGLVDAISKSQAMIEFNMDGTIITANENFLGAVGYTLDEIQGKHHSMFVDEAFKQSAEYKEFWASLNRGEFESKEYKRLGKGGKEIWIQASYNPIFDTNGKPFKVVKCATDVTAQKLQAADWGGQISAIGKSQAVIEFNMDGTIITANENFLGAVGYTLDEVQGKHHSLFVDEAFKQSAEYSEFWAKLNRGEYESKEYKRFGKGGKEIWIQASYNPIFDTNGKPFKVVKYATDVTAQKLQAADWGGQISAIGKSQAVIEFNMDGTIITANENFLGAVGYTLDEIQGKHHSIFVEEAFKQSAEYREFWASLNRGEFEAKEYKRLGKGGKEIWIQASYNPILDLNGKPFKVVKYATDITQQMLQADQAARLQGGVDGSSTASMQVDSDLKITYANQATLALVEKNKDTFQKAFPSVNFSNLIGVCVDIFHKDPSYQRRLLSDPNNLPHQADIEVGDLSFALNISVVRDLGGNHVGSTLEWQDITEQKAQANRAESLFSMIEQAATNFMTCDKDLIITYCNPSVLDMMRQYQAEIRKVYPSFDVEKLVGTCIDIFHANPSHQRNLLGNERNLPASAELNIGPLQFGVNATALKDSTGKMIGNGVEWTDLNERVKYGRQVTKVIEASNSGDLTVRGDVTELDKVYKPMMEGINKIVDAFEDALQRVSAPVAQVAAASSEINEGSQKLAEGASTQASSIEQISASLEQMSSMTTQNADNAIQANNLSKEALESADRGNSAMERMEEAIGKIKASSDETAKIVKTIDEIAFQTNLLALNAAVEAARAGDAGKGFAVVAEEVRSLAQRSAEAAKNTASLIEGAVKNADGGVSINEEVRAILSDIVEGSKKVNDLISEIAAASKEQSDGIKQVNDAVGAMDKVTQDNSANSEESAAAATELSSQAGELDELLSQFQLSGAESAPPARKRGAAPKRRPPARAKSRTSDPESVLPLDDDDMADF